MRKMKMTFRGVVRLGREIFTMMKSNSLGIALLLIAFSLGACVTMPTAEERANADYGEYPSNYADIIKNYMGCTKYPTLSCDFSNWKAPFKAYDYSNSPTVFGYGVCVRIAMFGSYNKGGVTYNAAGNLPHSFLINNGRVVRHYKHFDNIPDGAHICGF